MARARDALNMRSARIGVALIALVMVGYRAGASPRRAVTIYVSPGGDDSLSGLAPSRRGSDGPLATLEAAQAHARAIRARSPSARVKVCLQPGRYERRTTFELDRADSGSPTAPMTYAACGGPVQLVGGHELHAFRTVATPLKAQLDATAAPHVISIDLAAEGITDLGGLYAAGGGRPIHATRPELFENDRRLPLARWPNTGWARVTRLVNGSSSGRFIFDDARVSRWTHARDAWAYGFWSWDWADSYAQVFEVDPVQRQLTLNRAQIAYGIHPNHRFRVVNVLSELDEPGEWYLDRDYHQVLFWPTQPPGRSRIVLSTLSSPIVRISDASYVVLDGLVFEDSRGAGVEIVGGAHNRIIHAVFRNLGTYAVGIGGHSNEYSTRLAQDPLWNRNGGIDNGVDHCLIHDTGEGGVILGGGDRKTLTPAGNFVSNSEIHHYSEWVSTLRPAVEVDGVGNRVSHNLIHDGPHVAILVVGNDHRIESNEIHHVCQQTADAGAIYGGRDFTQRGWVIRNNYVHDLHPVSNSGGERHVVGIYLDDDLSGEEIVGNVFVDADNCVLIHGGGDNRVSENLFVRCTTAIRVVRADETSDAAVLMRRLKAVDPTHPPYAKRYPALARYRYPLGAYRNNVISKNIVAGGGWLYADSSGAIQVSSNDTGAAFDSAESGHFRVRTSPAAGSRFTPIRMETFGPSNREWLARDPP